MALVAPGGSAGRTTACSRRSRKEKTPRLRGFRVCKRLKGLEPSTFCMASGTAEVPSVRFYLQIETFCSFGLGNQRRKDARKFGSFHLASRSDLVVEGFRRSTPESALPGGVPRGLRGPPCLRTGKTSARRPALPRFVRWGSAAPHAGGFVSAGASCAKRTTRRSPTGHEHAADAATATVGEAITPPAVVGQSLGRQRTRATPDRPTTKAIAAPQEPNAERRQPAATRSRAAPLHEKR